MNWLSRMLGFKDIVMPDVEKILKEDKRHTKEMFLDKNNVRDKDISEPVLSFVKRVRENPKRFQVTLNYEFHDCKVVGNQLIYDDFPTRYTYTFLDTKTKESWSLSKGMEFIYCKAITIQTDKKHTYNPEWLTEDEKEYLITSIKTIFHDRRHRKEKLQDIRKQRRIRDERNRLKEIYK